MANSCEIPGDRFGTSRPRPRARNICGGGWRLARFLTWACTLIGLSDLLIAFSIAPFIGVTDHLTAQWYVLVFIGPFMIVAHVGCLAALLKKEGLMQY